jgi:hypothetical protein
LDRELLFLRITLVDTLSVNPEMFAFAVLDIFCDSVKHHISHLAWNRLSFPSCFDIISISSGILIWSGIPSIRDGSITSLGAFERVDVLPPQ